MRGTLVVGLLALGLLAMAVAWHEFAVGLQGYGPLPRDGELATWTLAVGTDGQTLTVAGPPDGVHLAVPLPPGAPALGFDTLTPGPLGRLVGLQPLVKLSGVGVGSGEGAGDGPPVKKPQAAIGGFMPLHGGTDGCWQILELTGFLGRLVARPGRVVLMLEAGSDGAGRVVVRDGRPELGATASGR